jgi:tRNA threonylcarbamoyladenosine biosynthesis protein TsaE
VTWRRRCVDAESTRRAGADLASALRAGDVVLLSGPLGAGKTVFAQGVGAGLGVTERVTSPTFTVVRQHRAHARASIRTLHHADVFRTNGLGEIVDLALGELVEEDAVAVVEWGEMAAPVLGDEVLQVSITVLADDAREIEVDGALAESRADELAAWQRG